MEVGSIPTFLLFRGWHWSLSDQLRSCPDAVGLGHCPLAPPPSRHRVDARAGGSRMRTRRDRLPDVAAPVFLLGKQMRQPPNGYGELRAADGEQPSDPVAVQRYLAKFSDSDDSGHLFQSDRGHHSSLIAVSLGLSRGPVWSCRGGAVGVRQRRTDWVKSAHDLPNTVTGAVVFIGVANRGRSRGEVRSPPHRSGQDAQWLRAPRRSSRHTDLRAERRANRHMRAVATAVRRPRDAIAWGDCVDRRRGLDGQRPEMVAPCGALDGALGVRRWLKSTRLWAYGLGNDPTMFFIATNSHAFAAQTA